MDNLQYRSSYRTRTGQLIHVWSDPYEPCLEDFDNTVEVPKVWVGANGWLFTPEGLERSKLKFPKNTVRRERENRETEEVWQLKGN